MGSCGLHNGGNHQGEVCVNRKRRTGSLADTVPTAEAFSVPEVPSDSITILVECNSSSVPPPINSLLWRQHFYTKRLSSFTATSIVLFLKTLESWLPNLAFMLLKATFSTAVPWHLSSLLYQKCLNHFLNLLSCTVFCQVPFLQASEVGHMGQGWRTHQALNRQRQWKHSRHHRGPVQDFAHRAPRNLVQLGIRGRKYRLQGAIAWRLHWS